MSDTPDPGGNARWRATVDALRALAQDPTESPARRRRAQQALDAETRPSGSAGSLLGQYQGGGTKHTRNGALHDLTDADVEGWVGHRG